MQDKKAAHEDFEDFVEEPETRDRMPGAQLGQCIVNTDCSLASFCEEQTTEEAFEGGRVPGSPIGDVEFEVPVLSVVFAEVVLSDELEGEQLYWWQSYVILCISNTATRTRTCQRLKFLLNRDFSFPTSSISNSDPCMPVVTSSPVRISIHPLAEVLVGAPPVEALTEALPDNSSVAEASRERKRSAPSAPENASAPISI